MHTYEHRERYAKGLNSYGICIMLTKYNAAHASGQRDLCCCYNTTQNRDTSSSALQGISENQVSIRTACLSVCDFIHSSLHL